MSKGLANHPTLREKVYEIIKAKIINKEFGPSARLQDNILANEFGISKTPVTLALTRLEYEGFVKTIPRKGTFVIDLSTNLATEYYLLREVLEGLAARLAAQNLPESDMEKMRKILPKSARDAISLSPKRYIEMDTRFHGIILNASEYPELQGAVKRIWDFVTMFKLRVAEPSRRRGESFKEHLSILKALQRRDAMGAEESMRFHIRRAQEALLKVFQAESEQRN